MAEFGTSARQSTLSPPHRHPRELSRGRTARALVVALVFLCCTTLIPGDALAGKKSPLHKKNFPAVERQAIDGVWRDPWGTFDVRFERGRAFQYRVCKEKISIPPKVWFSEIERVAAGRYRGILPATNPMFGKKGDEITISMLAENRIVVRVPIGDRTFQLVKLDSKNAYLEELQEAKRLVGVAPAPVVLEVEIGAPAIEITRAAIVPSAVVEPGSPFDVEVDFVVTGTTAEQKTESVVFAYSISTDGATVYDSEPTILYVPVGVSQSRRVHLTASEQEGDYRFEVMANLGGEVATQLVNLLVGGREALLDALAGTWLCEIPNFPSSRFELARRGDGLAFTALTDPSTQDDYVVDQSSVEVSGGELVVTVRSQSDGLGCSFTSQDTLPLAGNLRELHGTAEIIDGNWCIRIGETFNITYRKVE